MDTGADCLRRPDPFQCRKKGDSEQLLQDFKQYRAKMELFLTAVNTVDTHTGDPGERGDTEHKVCNSCKQEKAIIVLLGGEEMSELFEHVGVVTDRDSYVGAMDKVEQGIKSLTTARFTLFQERRQDSRCSEQLRPVVEANRRDRTNSDKPKSASDRSAIKKERGLHELPKGCSVPYFKLSQLVDTKWVRFRQRLGEQKEKFTLTDGELSMLLWEACQCHPMMPDYICETLSYSLSNRPTDMLGSIGSDRVLA